MKGGRWRDGCCRPAVLAVLISITWFISSGCSDGGPEAYLEVNDLRLTLLPSGAKIISGSVHNGSETDVSGVLVQISLFDDGNHLLSSITVGVEDVAAGSDRRFREPIDSDLAVERARVKKIVAL